eukprot:7009115-Prymnesium_polylepis.1
MSDRGSSAAPGVRDGTGTRSRAGGPGGGGAPIGTLRVTVVAPWRLARRRATCTRRTSASRPRPRARPGPELGPCAHVASQMPDRSRTRRERSIRYDFSRDAAVQYARRNTPHTGRRGPGRRRGGRTARAEHGGVCPEGRS